MSIKLQLPTLTDLRPRITVMGVGGAGCNAVNNMIAAGLSGVEFVVANTDAQALTASSAEHRLQLGINLTEGLGAGSKPEIGEAAAEEAIDEIRAQVSGSHMLFIAAGMGGGTGTGACSVISRVAQELGILTVGVVTKPFMFEGTRRQRTAEAGISELKKHVDTLIVIPNQNLFRIATERTTFAEAFVLADQVLYSGVACIVDLILKDGLINLDFADVRTVMRGMGAAMMGTGEAAGERRAIVAAEEAIANPLLDDVSLKGARGLLLSITGSHDMTLYEVDEAASRVRQEVDPEANIIVGATFDDTLADSIRVSIVASGMAREREQSLPPRPEDAESWPARKLSGEASSGASAGTNAYEQQLSAAIASGVLPKVSAQAPAGSAVHAGPPPFASGDGRQMPQPPPPPRQTWQAPGNVRIEAGYQPPGAGHVPPPVPQQRASSPAPVDPSSAARADGFRPQAPVEGCRSQRRMPEVEDFPPIAQREIQARAAAEQAGSRSGGGAAVQHSDMSPARRPGLFERIAGMGRRSGDSAKAETNSTRAHTASSGVQQNVVTPQTDHSPTNKQTVRSDGPSETVELPMFFGKSQR
ncbi:MAG: cell division protein FtsZ [Hyphomicrobiaceae bacterium]